MLILVSGMQRSGSSWFFSLVNAMLVEGGYDDGRAVNEEYRLGLNASCQIGRPFFWKVQRLLRISADGHTFAVKNHKGPYPYLRKQIERGKVVPLYIYRDPRDVVVSAYEMGQRQRSKGKLPVFGFARLVSIAYTISWVQRRLLPVWEQWAGMSECLCVKYETLGEEGVRTCEEVAAFLNLDIPSGKLADIVRRHDKATIVNGTDHLNKARIARYRDVLSGADLQRCNAAFSPYLKKMGYAE